MAKCPFHNDKNPSFSFNAENGLWQCFGCGEKGNAYQFLEKLGYAKEEILKELSEVDDKYRQKPKLNSLEELKSKYEIHKVYVYLNLYGIILYKKHRFENPKDKNLPKKTFYIEWLTEDRKLILYNLPSLRINSEYIYITEGEKCAETVNEALPESEENVAVLGYNNFKKEFENSNVKEYFKNKKIVIFADNDEVGIKKAKEVVDTLKGIVKEIKLVQFKDKPQGYDIADWLEEGNSLEDALVLAETEYERAYEDIDFKRLLIEGVPEREFLDREFNVPRGVLSVVAGYGNVGKGYLMLWFSLRWIKEGYNICYFSGEDDKEEIKRRILKIIPKTGFDVDSVKGRFRVYEGQEIFTSLIDVLKDQIDEGFNVFIIDPLSFFVEDENLVSQNAKLFRELQYLCKKKKVNIFILHHLRKFGLKDAKDKYEMLDAIRGSGSFHNNARFVWMLKRDKENKCTLEVYNCKNSYAPNDKDFKITNLFPDCKDDIRYEFITLEPVVKPQEQEGEELDLF